MPTSVKLISVNIRMSDKYNWIEPFVEVKINTLIITNIPTWILSLKCIHIE